MFADQKVKTQIRWFATVREVGTDVGSMAMVAATSAFGQAKFLLERVKSNCEENWETEIQCPSMERRLASHAGFPVRNPN